ncbi:unnamed protein product [Rotaria sordida]|uniref:Uncharacterized protein n=1 Tax=Rotaria sordida TaxID=392033 RepID=A0A815ZPW9_9BILA|nr:unnamed protein product [Rotaria sordida]CAF1585637.1 unnamed protein product [Rotaria sordida]
MAIDLIIVYQREIDRLTTRINELKVFYMANQITAAQTIELSQAAGQKLLAQFELDKLNAEGQRRNNANPTTATGSN